MEKKSILIADDDPVSRTGIQRFLERACYDVDVFDDGEAAIHAVMHKAYDIAILDYRMPKMGGLELGLSIRKLCEDKTSIIGITASADCCDSFYKSGASAFFNKPLDQSELLHTIENLLNKQAITTTGNDSIGCFQI